MRKYVRFIEGKCDQPCCNYYGLIVQTIYMDCEKNICKECLEKLLKEMIDYERINQVRTSH